MLFSNFEDYSFFSFCYIQIFFEDCSFLVSIVLKYLFLYSNILCFCTAVLHSKYLLHIYIQIFVNINGFAFGSD